MEDGLFLLRFSCKDGALKPFGNVSAFESEASDEESFTVCYEHEKHLIARRKGNVVQLFTTNRNKIPLYASRTKDVLEVSCSPLPLCGGKANLDIQHVISDLAGTKFMRSCIFQGVDSLIPSSTYEFDLDNGSFCHKGLNLRQRKTDRVDFLDRLVNRFENIAEDGRNIYIMISAGYDSRLWLALARQAAKKSRNRIRLLHVLTDHASLKIVRQIAKACNLELIAFEPSDLVSSFEQKMLFPYRTGSFHIALYMYLPMIERIRTQDKHATIIGLGTGCLKGRRYYETDYEWPLRTHSPNKRFLVTMAQLAGSSFEQGEALFERALQGVRAATAASEVFEDKYQRYDVMNMLLDHCEVGPRMFPLMAEHGMPFCVDDDVMTSDFISLPTQDKASVNFILYALATLEEPLLEIPFLSGNVADLGISESSEAATPSRLPQLPGVIRKLANAYNQLGLLSLRTCSSRGSSKFPGYKRAYQSRIADANDVFSLFDTVSEDLCRYVLDDPSVSWGVKLKFSQYADFISNRDQAASRWREWLVKRNNERIV